MSPRGRGRRALLALDIAVAAVALGAAEWVLLPRFLPLPRDVWLMGFAADAPLVDGVAINALGFTGDAPAPGDPGMLHVLTLGGSVLFDRDFTARLRRHLAPRVGGPFGLTGAALRAHTSRSSVLKWRLLADRGWDVVVVYDGINDLVANHARPADYRDDYAHLGAWYVRGPLVDRSVIARLLYNELWHRPLHGEGMASGFRSVESLRANLRELVESARAHGATPVVSTFAWALPADYDLERFRRGELGYANPERYDVTPVETWGPAPWVAEGLARTNVAIHEVARDTGALLFDAERVLGRDLRWFGDVCHPSAAGVERLAEALAGFLAEEGLLVPRPGRAR
jgi:hypothetical protein